MKLQGCQTLQSYMQIKLDFNQWCKPTCITIKSFSFHFSLALSLVYTSIIFYQRIHWLTTKQLALQTLFSSDSRRYVWIHRPHYFDGDLYLPQFGITYMYCRWALRHVPYRTNGKKLNSNLSFWQAALKFCLQLFPLVERRPLFLHIREMRMKTNLSNKIQ